MADTATPDVSDSGAAASTDAAATSAAPSTEPPKEKKPPRAVAYKHDLSAHLHNV